MQFVKTDNLKIGMRLARPIYNKKGVLLFERDSKLSAQAIESVKNFNLLGLYILEPAEPVPPMTEEDLEFERFQTMAIFSIREELEKILATGKQTRVQSVVSMIIKNYGHLENKISFYQSLRSREDYVYKHSLNVAILCAMITHIMKMKREEQHQAVTAAVVHDIGKLSRVEEIVDSDSETDDSRRKMVAAQLNAMEMIEHILPEGESIRRICTQAVTAQEEFYRGAGDASKLLPTARVLLVANRYDELTAMKLDGTAESEVKALQEFMDHPEVYDPKVVSALVSAVNILFPGVSVELSTGEKALVLVGNENDVLRPMVLSFLDNNILDLSLPVNKDIRIVDVMKTLDNRYIMDNEALERMGFQQS